MKKNKMKTIKPKPVEVVETTIETPDIKQPDVLYVYQLSLADGTIMLDSSPGLFVNKKIDDQVQTVLINSATLIKVIDKTDAEIKAEVSGI